MLLHQNDFWNCICNVTNQRNRQPADAAVTLAEANILPNNINCDKNVDRAPESQSYHTSIADQIDFNSCVVSTNATRLSVVVFE